VNLDFKDDQIAIEAHVRMRCGWRDEDEISEEEYREYAVEYMEENPFLDDIVKLPREAIMYDRFAGELTFWKRIPFTEFYWQRGEFWRGMHISLICLGVNLGVVQYPRKERIDGESTFRKLGLYFGLLEYADDFREEAD
jgi:hypothetical protein